MAERNPPKLLLVEDDLGLQRQLAWAFDDFEVFRASDRASAEAVLSRERPSVVLLDRSEEHTSELQSLMRKSYAVFCLKKKNKKKELLVYNHIHKIQHIILR